MILQVQDFSPDLARARCAIEDARRQGRDRLDATGARALLAAYGVALPSMRLAMGVDAVASCCRTLEPPYAVKIVSRQLVRKASEGGVALAIATPAAAEAAARAMTARLAQTHPDVAIDGFEVSSMAGQGVELRIVMRHDPVVGPVLTLGRGPETVEIARGAWLSRDDGDRADLALLAGDAIDVSAVRHALGVAAAIALDLPDVVEFGIDPLLAGPEGVVVIDAHARIAHCPTRTLLAHRRVPMEWASDLATRAGLALHVRPVLPEDGPVMEALFAALSPADLHNRFLSAIRHIDPARIGQMTQVDYDRTVSFLAFADGEAVATAMLAVDEGRPDEAEVAIVVRSDLKGHGIGWTLLEHMLRYAESRGLRTVRSIEAGDNVETIALEREMGFTIRVGVDGAHETIATRPLIAG
jgi:acetyltransferase